MGRIEYYYVKLYDHEDYLEDMQLRLGTFFDVGVNQCGLSGQQVARAFIDSGVAQVFEEQNPAFISGKSGVELLEIAFERCGISCEVPNEDRMPVSPEYWVGYSLPCFQVSTGYTYKRLFEVLAYDDLRGLHYRMQERSEEEFVETVLELIKSRSAPNRLKKMRREWKMTQAELSLRSGVSLRSIQLYEQGVKDLNHAAADTVRRLSKALRCSMEDLMEFGV